jgi:hypothetical protein
MDVGLASKVKLAGGNGTGLARLGTGDWCFNGEGDAGAYETFHVRRGATKNARSFCKTAHRPYDILVCCALIILHHYMPEFKVSSDGGPEEWEPAVSLCQRVLGYGVYPCGDDSSQAVVAQLEEGILIVGRTKIQEGI